MARPKVSNPKIKVSLTINSELDDILNKVCEEKGVNKSKYIEHLIKKDIQSKQSNH